MMNGKVFLFSGEKYLHTSKLLLDKICESKNKWYVSSDKYFSEDEYNKITEYSDFMIMIPTLFNFYHGLELIVKGMIKIHGENFDTIHDIERLFFQLKNVDNSGDKYITLISKYVEKPLKIRFLNDFMKQEQIENINDLYMSFRYPADKKFLKIYKYFCIQYKENEIINEVKEISNDIENILIGAIKVYRDVCDNKE